MEMIPLGSTTVAAVMADDSLILLLDLWLWIFSFRLYGQTIIKAFSETHREKQREREREDANKQNERVEASVLTILS